ncbi:efflux RND transporter permease subunit [Paracoccus rhizosphaerae]|uniref:efflux RND transporter permease subunit n=1 Tax=Paracoccus rhizosphaerae TaxID=1133347 RepID=UPI003613FE57
MKRFNLSDWALRHRSFVWFLLIVSMVAGTISYLNLGREEDPNFTIKTMIIAAALPGATIDETLTQVTTRIETKLEELDELDFTRSVTMPGQAVVYVELDPTIRGPAVPEVWKRVRQMMSDIRPDFPREFQGFSSTTTSAMCSATSMRLPLTASPCASCATGSRRSGGRCRRWTRLARPSFWESSPRRSSWNSRLRGWLRWG